MAAEITHTNDKIYLKITKADKLGITDYTEELFKKITAENWHKNGDYIRSSKLKMSLHQLVMAHWYGQDKLDESKKNGFIVEHHNNNGFDCQISNLSFVPENQNKQKAFGYDIEREAMINKFAINFYKNFETGRYQITIGCNEPHYIIDLQKKTATDVTTIYLIYNDDFYRTLMDATSILHELKEYERVSLSNLRYDEFYYQEANYIPPDTPEDQIVFIDDNGRVAARLGTPQFIINQIGENKDLYKKKDS